MAGADQAVGDGRLIICAGAQISDGACVEKLRNKGVFIARRGRFSSTPCHPSCEILGVRSLNRGVSEGYQAQSLTAWGLNGAMSEDRRQALADARKLLRSFASAPDMRRRAAAVFSELRRAEDWSRAKAQAIADVDSWLRDTPSVVALEPRLRALLARLDRV